MDKTGLIISQLLHDNAWGGGRVALKALVYYTLSNSLLQYKSTIKFSRSGQDSIVNQLLRIYLVATPFDLLHILSAELKLMENSVGCHTICALRIASHYKL